MLVATIEAQLWGELGESVMRVHFDAIIFATTLIRRLERAAISRAGEGEEFVEAVAKATEGTVGAIDCAVGGTGLATVLVILANDLFRDFDEAVKDIAQCTTKLARGGLSGTWRRLDIGGNKTAQGGKGGSDDEEFFHAAEKLVNRNRGWQRISLKSTIFTVQN